MKLSTLLYEAGYGEIPVPQDIEIHGISSDTRAVKNGDLFVAMRGGRIDSHTLVKEAEKRGAVCAAVEAGCFSDRSVGILLVSLSDTRSAFARLSDAFYGHPACGFPLIGVTGTNGKTTVTHLLYEILERAGRRVGRIGTVEGRSCGRVLRSECADPEAHMTTPDPPVLYRMLSEMRDDGCEYAVMEATSHASALHKLDPLKFDLLIFTNLTLDHLDFHKTKDAYFEAKARLFRQTRRALMSLDGSAVFGDPDGYAERIVRIARESGAEVFTCSADRSKDPDFLLSDLRETFGGENEGITFRLTEGTGKHDFVVRSPLLGKYNGMNLLESAAAALLLGISEEKIKEALRCFPGVPGRTERIDLGHGADIAVFVDFAHTPDALENLLKAVHGFRRDEGRITVLFGCGGDRDPSKRREMAHIASRLADLVYITSDNSRSEDPNAIIKDILKGIDKEKPHCVITDRRLAIENAVLTAREGDILLLCGKGHERYTVDRDGVHDFCEADIVREAYRRRKGAENFDINGETEG